MPIKFKTKFATKTVDFDITAEGGLKFQVRAAKAELASIISTLTSKGRAWGWVLTTREDTRLNVNTFPKDGFVKVQVMLDINGDEQPVKELTGDSEVILAKLA